MNRGNERLERLLAAAQAVSSESSLEDTLRALLEQALEGVGGRLGWVAVAESSGLRVLAVKGVERPSVGELIPFDRGLTGRAWRLGRPHYSPDVSREDAYWKVAPEVRSEFVLPLVWSGRGVGVLNIESTSIDGLAGEDRDFLKTLGGLAAGVVARSLQELHVRSDLKQKEADLSARLNEIRALISAARALSASLDLREITRTVLGRAAEITGAEFCHLLLEDQQTGELTMHTTTDLVGGLSEGSPVDISRGVTGWVATNRQALLVGNVQKDPRYVPWRSETASELAVPLLDGGNLLGVLNLESSRLNAFDSYDMEVAGALAGLISSAARNARLFNNLRIAREGLSLTEGLRAAGEAAADVVHWVANKIGGFPDALRVLQREAPHVPDERRETFNQLIRTMEDAAHDVLNVKRAVMDAARPLRPETVNLKPVVDELVEQQLKPGAGILVEGSDGTSVLADPYALRRMLDNAVQNALRHGGTHSGAPGGETAAVRWKEDGADVVIEVTDNGPGFPSEMLQLGAVPRLGSSGTGMGLWLSSRLADRMGGRLELSNRPSGGAKVNIILPSSEQS